MTDNGNGTKGVEAFEVAQISLPQAALVDPDGYLELIHTASHALSDAIEDVLGPPPYLETIMDAGSPDVMVKMGADEAMATILCIKLMMEILIPYREHARVHHNGPFAADAGRLDIPLDPASEP